VTAKVSHPRCNNLCELNNKRGKNVHGQGKVVIGQDAGQVVAGNAVTHINRYVSKHCHGAMAVAFFWAPPA
jgi:hypothetical protein